MEGKDSHLKKLMILMDQAFREEGKVLEPLTIERMAEGLHDSMSARYRTFHTLDHVVFVAQGLKGVAILAALFHDAIYYQVDRRIHPSLLVHLPEFEIDSTNECVLPDLQDGDRTLRWAAKIFGFKKGEVRHPGNGLNEFLSAIVAARALSRHLEAWQLIQILGCIEATIPFRSQSESTKDPVRTLSQKLTALNKEEKLKVSPAEIQETVRQAVQLANQDIGSFYSEDFGDFISGTWNLLLENNPIFKNKLYSVSEYSKALQKVHHFFSGLKTENVVHHWGEFPEESILKRMRAQVEKNLSDAIFYLDLKMMEINLLGVFANISGGDASYFLLVGESTSRSDRAPIERFFPMTKKLRPGINSVVHQVLKEGRKMPSSFDFKHSPIATYLYENLTDAEITQAIAKGKDLIAARLDGEEFLKIFRPEILAPIKKGISEVSWSRQLV